MLRRTGWLFAVAVVILCGAPTRAADPPPAPPDESFYNQSLHYTNRGIEWVYSKEQGGLETITGVPASELGCTAARCHARTCDTCHRKDVDGKAAFTVDPAVAQAACEKCHGAPEKDDPDVHVRAGMKCMDCHSVREIHGDGVLYDSFNQPGVLDTRCGKCHPNPGRSASHTVHGGKLDCSACHSREAANCLNCHIETRIQDKKSVSIRMDGMLFLVNHEDRVTPANFLSYVSGNRTMITLAPSFGHSIRKEGRRCPECHGSPTVRAIAGDRFVAASWKKGKLTNAKGVIPVLDGMTWRIPYLTRRDTTWVPLPRPDAPVVHFSGFCGPLTREQLARLERPQGGD